MDARSTIAAMAAGVALGGDPTAFAPGVDRSAWTAPGSNKPHTAVADIEIEISKVRSFQEQVANGAHFNMASVLGILGDYGIGNAMEKGSAERSATGRMNQLQDLKVERGCTGTTLSAADDRIAAASIGNATNASLSADPLDAPGTINLGRGVKLRPSNSLSGYCIQAPPGYVGTGAANMPAATSARPVCS